MAAKKKARKARPVAAKPVEEVSQIRVRALKTGYSGHLLRNIGDVFLMDTGSLEKAPTADEIKALSPASKARLDGYDMVDVDGVEYLLPSWVDLADADEDVTPPKGHTGSAPDEEKPKSVL